MSALEHSTYSARNTSEPHTGHQQSAIWPSWLLGSRKRAATARTTTCTLRAPACRKGGALEQTQGPGLLRQLKQTPVHVPRATGGDAGDVNGLPASWSTLLMAVFKKDYQVGCLLLAFLGRSTLVLTSLMAALTILPMDQAPYDPHATPYDPQDQSLPSRDVSPDARDPRDTSHDSFGGSGGSSSVRSYRQNSPGVASLLLALGMAPGDVTDIMTGNSIPDDHVFQDLMRNAYNQLAGSALTAPNPLQQQEEERTAPLTLDDIASAGAPAPAAAASGNTLQYSGTAASDNVPRYSNVLDDYTFTTFRPLPALTLQDIVGGGGAGDGAGGRGKGGGWFDGWSFPWDGEGGLFSEAQLELLLRCLQVALAVFVITPPAAVHLAGSLALKAMAVCLAPTEDETPSGMLSGRAPGMMNALALAPSALGFGSAPPPPLRINALRPSGTKQQGQGTSTLTQPLTPRTLDNLFLDVFSAVTASPGSGDGQQPAAAAGAQRQLAEQLRRDMPVASSAVEAPATSVVASMRKLLGHGSSVQDLADSFMRLDTRAQEAEAEVARLTAKSMAATAVHAVVLLAHTAEHVAGATGTGTRTAGAAAEAAAGTASDVLSATPLTRHEPMTLTFQEEVGDMYGEVLGAITALEASHQDLHQQTASLAARFISQAAVTSVVAQSREAELTALATTAHKQLLATREQLNSVEGLLQQQRDVTTALQERLTRAEEDNQRITASYLSQAAASSVVSQARAAELEDALATRTQYYAELLHTAQQHTAQLEVELRENSLAATQASAVLIADNATLQALLHRQEAELEHWQAGTEAKGEQQQQVEETQQLQLQVAAQEAQLQHLQQQHAFEAQQQQQLAAQQAQQQQQLEEKLEGSELQGFEAQQQLAAQGIELQRLQQQHASEAQQLQLQAAAQDAELQQLQQQHASEAQELQLKMAAQEVRVLQLEQQLKDSLELVLQLQRYQSASEDQQQQAQRDLQQGQLDSQQQQADLQNQASQVQALQSQLEQGSLVCTQLEEKLQTEQHTSERLRQELDDAAGDLATSSALLDQERALGQRSQAELKQAQGLLEQLQRDLATSSSLLDGEKLQVQATQAELEQAKAQVAQLQQQLEQATLQAEQTHSQLQRDLVTSSSLLDGEKLQVQTTQAELQQAQTQVAQLQQQLEQATLQAEQTHSQLQRDLVTSSSLLDGEKLQVQTTQAELQQAQTQVAQLQQQLEQATLQAEQTHSQLQRDLVTSSSLLDGEKLQVQATQAELRQAQTQVAQLQQQLEQATLQAEQTHSQLQRDLVTSSSLLDGEKLQVQTTQAELQQAQTQVAQLQQQLEQATLQAEQTHSQLQRDLVTSSSLLDAEKLQVQATQAELQITRDHLVQVQQMCEVQSIRVEELQGEMDRAQAVQEAAKASYLAQVAALEQTIGQLTASLAQPRSVRDDSCMDDKALLPTDTDKTLAGQTPSSPKPQAVAKSVRDMTQQLEKMQMHVALLQNELLSGHVALNAAESVPSKFNLREFTSRSLRASDADIPVVLSQHHVQDEDDPDVDRASQQSQELPNNPGHPGHLGTAATTTGSKVSRGNSTPRQVFERSSMFTSAGTSVGSVGAVGSSMLRSSANMPPTHNWQARMDLMQRRLEVMRDMASDMQASLQAATEPEAAGETAVAGVMSDAGGAGAAPPLLMLQPLQMEARRGTEEGAMMAIMMERNGSLMNPVVVLQDTAEMQPTPGVLDASQVPLHPSRDTRTESAGGQDYSLGGAAPTAPTAPATQPCSTRDASNTSQTAGPPRSSIDDWMAHGMRDGTMVDNPMAMTEMLSNPLARNGSVSVASSVRQTPSGSYQLPPHQQQRASSVTTPPKRATRMSQVINMTPGKLSEVMRWAEANAEEMPGQEQLLALPPDNLLVGLAGGPEIVSPADLVLDDICLHGSIDADATSARNSTSNVPDINVDRDSHVRDNDADRDSNMSSLDWGFGGAVSGGAAFVGNHKLSQLAADADLVRASMPGSTHSAVTPSGTITIRPPPQARFSHVAMGSSSMPKADNKRLTTFTHSAKSFSRSQVLAEESEQATSRRESVDHHRSMSASKSMRQSLDLDHREEEGVARVSFVPHGEDDVGSVSGWSAATSNNSKKSFSQRLTSKLSKLSRSLTNKKVQPEEGPSKRAS